VGGSVKIPMNKGGPVSALVPKRLLGKDRLH
jgi:hypothetical protein